MIAWAIAIGQVAFLATQPLLVVFAVDRGSAHGCSAERFTVAWCTARMTVSSNTTLTRIP